jgi:hypothetical protein
MSLAILRRFDSVDSPLRGISPSDFSATFTTIAFDDSGGNFGF